MYNISEMAIGVLDSKPQIDSRIDKLEEVVELLVRQEALRIKLEEALFCKHELAAPGWQAQEQTVSFSI